MADLRNKVFTGVREFFPGMPEDIYSSEKGIQP